jgi:hypothetical protein
LTTAAASPPARGQTFAMVPEWAENLPAELYKLLGMVIRLQYLGVDTIPRIADKIAARTGTTAKHVKRMIRRIADLEPEHFAIVTDEDGVRRPRFEPPPAGRNAARAARDEAGSTVSPVHGVRPRVHSMHPESAPGAPPLPLSSKRIKSRSSEEELNSEEFAREAPRRSRPEGTAATPTSPEPSGVPLPDPWTGPALAAAAAGSTPAPKVGSCPDLPSRVPPGGPDLTPAQAALIAGLPAEARAAWDALDVDARASRLKPLAAMVVVDGIIARDFAAKLRPARARASPPPELSLGEAIRFIAGRREDVAFEVLPSLCGAILAAVPAAPGQKPLRWKQIEAALDAIRLGRADPEVLIGPLGRLRAKLDVGGRVDNQPAYLVSSVKDANGGDWPGSVPEKKPPDGCPLEKAGRRGASKGLPPGHSRMVN